jgi:hypothetical protein
MRFTPATRRARPPLSIWFSPDGSTFTRISDSYQNGGFDQGSLNELSYLIVGTPRTSATANCPVGSGDLRTPAAHSVRDRGQPRP